MKKVFVFSSLVLIGSLALTGCSTDNNTPTGDKTPTATKSAQVTNPIRKEETLLKETSFASGLNVKIYQIGFGYPTQEEMRLWDDKSKDKLPKTGTLDSKRRVVALRYDVTNATGNAIDVKRFNPRNAYFTDSGKMDNQAQPSFSDDSLHGMLKSPSNPSAFKIDDPVWTLAPGKTASWSLDWLMPEDKQSDQTISITQNFSVGSNEWASGNEIILNLNKK
jgi:hypothetical protein